MVQQDGRVVDDGGGVDDGRVDDVVVDETVAVRDVRLGVAARPG